MLLQILLTGVLAVTGPNADIRPLLRAQGFEWTLEKADSNIEHVGYIKQRRRTYSIYLYNGTNRENLHGINFFIIILNRNHVSRCLRLPICSRLQH